MKTIPFKVTVHMVSSLDGIIAKTDNSISWFETSHNYEKGEEGQNPEEFLKSIDCYVMGSRTYEHALELSKDYGWAYGEKPTIVVTKRSFSTDRNNVQFYSGDLSSLVNDMLKPHYKNVWVAGGSLLTRNLIQQNLVNEIHMSILPVILGGGLPFFDHIGKEIALQLLESKAYRTGMIELRYKIIE